MILLSYLIDELYALRDLYKILKDLRDYAHTILEEKGRAKYVSGKLLEESEKERRRKGEEKRSEVFPLGSDFFVVDLGEGDRSRSIVVTRDNLYVTCPQKPKFNFPSKGKSIEVNLLTESRSFVDRGIIEYFKGLQLIKEETGR